MSARRKISGAYGVKVSTYALDLSTLENNLRLARECGPLDILVNNVGSTPHGRIADFDDKACRAAWDLKVFGYISLTREVYRDMCARKRGVIINIVGGTGKRPKADHIVSSMANAAVMAMTCALGAESVDYGVRVVGVSPGPTETGRQVKHLKGRAQKELGDENRWRELTAGFQLGRPASVDEVAAMVVFLCSDRSNYTSGTVIFVDGGKASRK